MTTTPGSRTPARCTGAPPRCHRSTGSRAPTCRPTEGSATNSGSGATTYPSSRADPVRSPEVLSHNSAMQRARQLWGRHASGAATKAVVAAAKIVGAFMLLLVGMRVALRNNPPPAGEIFFGAIIGLLY